MRSVTRQKTRSCDALEKVERRAKPWASPGGSLSKRMMVFKSSQPLPWVLQFSLVNEMGNDNVQVKNENQR